MGEPDFNMEQTLYSGGLHRIVGVDEAGRGPLAGPVLAAAVWLDPACIPPGLNNSKKLTALRRADLRDKLAACAQIGIGEASVAEIDEMNILRASHLAMMRAIAALPFPPCHLLIDGNLLPRGLLHPATAVIGGDGLSASIAAASIVAKTARDRIMGDLAQHYPGYGWETNMGYPSKSHRQALRDLGVTPHHRRSFRPVHNILYQE